MSEPTVRFVADAKDAPDWTVRFEAKRAGFDYIGLTKGGDLLALPGQLWLKAGDPDKDAVGTMHYWQPPEGVERDSDFDNTFNVSCFVPAEHFRQIIDSIERGRPPLSVAITIPTLIDLGKWEIGARDDFGDTWHAISRVSFTFDHHPEPEPEPDEPEPLPIPTDKLIASALGYLRLDLAKYATIGGALLVVLILVVLWRR
ncbi:hypothetical protein [Sphingomonas sp.]|uniref:hypothetical protein n=1 Tax=Sphingomonas sp. TaxID=28214 RepID=UPI0025EF1F69|nr:hypothetical protein [Sphingomonas sp.]